MDLLLVAFVSTAFAAVAGLTYALGQLVMGRNRLKRRLPAGVRTPNRQMQTSGDSIGALLVERRADDRFGIGGESRKKFKLKLVRAGYFNQNASQAYALARLCSIITAPSIVLIAFAIILGNVTTLEAMAAASIACAVGALAPDAYLSRRQSSQIEEYRRNLPDLLDLLTVCVTAGLSVEASFDRIRDQLSKRSRALGRNVELMGAEMRAGRSFVDALASLADRLGLDEAASFVAVLRHSVELGGDVATTLREFSEEMRVRRMLLAEQKANELPVKMVIPLALGIFPVILMIVLLPVILKLLRVIGP
jgi:tight adherence protein C